MTTTTTIWDRAMRDMPAGTIYCDGRYRVVSIDAKRIKCERVATGSPFAVSRKMVERTDERLTAGEFIPKQTNGPGGGISYTVSIEQTVLAIVGDYRTTTENGKAGYRR